MEPVALLGLVTGAFLLLFGAAVASANRREPGLAWFVLFSLAAATSTLLPELRVGVLADGLAVGALVHFLGVRRRTERIGSAWLWALLALASGLHFALGARSRLALVVLMAAISLGALAAFGRAARVHAAERTRASAALLAAVALGGLPLLHLFPAGLNFMQAAAGGWSLPVGDVVLVYAPLAVIALLFAIRGESRMERVAPWLGIGFAILVHASYAELRHGASFVPPAAAGYVVAIAPPLRWLAFGAFGSVALLSGTDPVLRPGMQRAARVLVAGVFALAAVLLVSAERIHSGATAGLSPVEWGFVALAIGLSQGFRFLVDGVARRLYGWPRPVEADGMSPGALLAGRYRVAALLGRGGGGRVFLARDLQLARDVALKELPVGLAREARALAAVQHPNVIAIHDVVPTSEATVLVTEFAPGGSLAAKLHAGELGPDDPVRICAEVLAGLGAVHAAGVAHGDVKPANVLLGQNGEAKLADFGAAALPGARTMHVGTPEYLAPEQQATGATVATDLYQAALLLQECLAGRGSGGLRRVIERALAPDPGLRYPSAASMREAVLAASPV